MVPNGYASTHSGLRVGKHLSKVAPRIGSYAERQKNYHGKKKGVGLIARQMASMIFALLKTGWETLNRVPPGQDILVPGFLTWK